MTFFIRCLCCTLVLVAPVMAGDRDGDGVPDSKDACPRTSATVASGNGCPAQAAQEARTVVLLFDSGSSVVRQDQLKKLQPWMNKWQGHQLVVKGHADERGGASTNQTLSRARAEAVADVLQLNFGVDRRSLSLHALGESEPLKENDQGLAANRRVEVVAQPVTLKLIKGD
ncbi:hypothetical protein F0521_08230 [Ferrimonas sp. YFM]|nr:hypothetical protein F0521_08230 [Ferrimonas sp. YFM]